MRNDLVRITRSTDNDGTVVLLIVGEVDRSNSRQLAAALDRVLASHPRAVVVDAHSWSYLDASAIRVLLGAAGIAGENDVGFGVRNPTAVVRKALQIVDADSLMLN